MRNDVGSTNPRVSSRNDGVGVGVGVVGPDVERWEVQPRTAAATTSAAAADRLIRALSSVQTRAPSATTYRGRQVLSAHLRRQLGRRGSADPFRGTAGERGLFSPPALPAPPGRGETHAVIVQGERVRKFLSVAPVLVVVCNALAGLFAGLDGSSGLLRMWAATTIAVVGGYTYEFRWGARRTR
jgi:hypothetical protein